MRFITRHPVAITVPLVILIWAVASEMDWVGKTVLASPLEVIEQLVNATKAGVSHDKAIFYHAFQTIVLALSGWGLACIIGLVIGVAVGSRRAAYLGVEPILEFGRAIPPVLAFPLFLVAFSFTRSAYMWTIVFGCFPIMCLTVSKGIQGMDAGRLELLRVHETSYLIRLFAAFMEVLPSAFLGARITFSMSLVIAVVTEMVFTPRSGWALGSLAKDAEISFDTPTFYACIVVIGTYGYLANVVLRRVEGRLRGSVGGVSEQEV